MPLSYKVNQKSFSSNFNKIAYQVAQELNKLKHKLIKKRFPTLSRRLQATFMRLDLELLEDMQAWFEGIMRNIMSKTLDQLIYYTEIFKGNVYVSEDHLAEIVGSKNGKALSKFIVRLKNSGLIRTRKNFHPQFKGTNNYWLHPMFFMAETRPFLLNYFPSLNKLPIKNCDITIEDNDYKRSINRYSIGNTESIGGILANLGFRGGGFKRVGEIGQEIIKVDPVRRGPNKKFTLEELNKAKEGHPTTLAEAFQRQGADLNFIENVFAELGIELP